MRIPCFFLLLLTSIAAFAPSLPSTRAPLSTLRMSNEELDKKFGGYTVKQRLREEVESPFRTVRLFFFGSSTASALIALYFSLLSLLKVSMGGFSDAPPMEEALQSCGINLGALILCGALTYRDWQAGEANLARIAKGGALAKLVVTPASDGSTAVSLADYRRRARVLIAAGGEKYIDELSRSLNADQRQDRNTIAAGLAASDVMIVPILLQGDGSVVGDTKACWVETTPQEGDKNFDMNRANSVIAFPQGNSQWSDYLKTEVETATKQGFDVIDKGFIILVKKNGRVLRRATGQPPFGELINTMEVLDGSKFGMPGDDEKYGVDPSSTAQYGRTASLFDEAKTK